MTIPNSVTFIGRGAFVECSSLTSISIPNSVSHIGADAFDYTPWFYNQPDGLVYAGLVAYKYKGTMPNNTSIIIQDGTVSISTYAFGWLEGLTSVTIPNTVTTIGEEAFNECNSLNSVICHALTPPKCIDYYGEDDYWGYYDAFSSTNYSQATLYVPGEALAAYQSDRFWEKFENILPIVDVLPGDIDGDGVIGIGDVTGIIDLILAGNATIEDYPAADANGDGIISIADVTHLIDIILYPNN